MAPGDASDWRGTVPQGGVLSGTSLFTLNNQLRTGADKGNPTV